TDRRHAREEDDDERRAHQRRKLEPEGSRRPSVGEPAAPALNSVSSPISPSSLLSSSADQVPSNGGRSFSARKIANPPTASFTDAILAASPPDSESSTDADDHSLLPNVLAGMARSFATQSLMVLTGFGKGILKWFFRVPVKLFRPSLVNPLLLFSTMAQQEGARVSVGYVGRVVREEGWGLLGRNMLPLLICNSVVGAVLFNAYSGSMAYLQEKEESEEGGAVLGSVKHHPFTAGAIAGAAQALLSTPLDNVTRRVDPAEMVARRGEGVVGVMIRSFKEAMPPGLNAWGKFRFSYHGLGYNVGKDAVVRMSPIHTPCLFIPMLMLLINKGFGLFFGFFETFRKLGKRLVLDAHLAHGWPAHRLIPDPSSPEGNLKQRPTLTLTLGSVAAVIAAGTAAGMGYQSVSYPLDRIPAALAENGYALATRPVVPEEGMEAGGGATRAAAPREPKVDWRSVFKLVRAKGLTPFYRGIGTQLVRVTPPSAIGLLIFEVANSQLWEDED
ncbi:hypothetical protein HK101_006570, partial [Irineochytrium annulatum]